MSPYIKELSKKLTETCNKLMADIPSIRIGLLAFGINYLSLNSFSQFCRIKN